MIKPHTTEKSFLASQKGVYTFLVPPKTTKRQIKQEVEANWKVEVILVRTCRQSGKRRRSIRLESKMTKRVLGQRSAFKKAFVSLKPGQIIPNFLPPNDQPSTEAE